MDKKIYTPSTILRCPPTYYWIAEKLNGLMNTKIQPDLKKTGEQDTVIHNLSTKLGMPVYEMEAQPGLTEMPFTANGAWGVYNEETKQSEIVLSNFLWDRRQGEKEHYRKWIKERLGFTTFELPEYPRNPSHTVFFEGQGDVVTATHAYFMGYGQRTSKKAKEYLERLLCLKKPLIPLELISDDFYHLDTCMMSLPEKNALIFYGGAFGAESLLGNLNGYIQEHTVATFRMNKNLAYCLAANSVYINDVILLNVPFPDYSNEAFEKSARGEFLDWNDIRYKEIIEEEPEYQGLIKFLWGLGYKIIPVYTSEFRKSGAGVRCTMLFLQLIPSRHRR